MELKKKVCVVIPIHSANPTKQELLSFKQCFDVLAAHPIFVVAPKGLNLKKYTDIIKDFTTIFIDSKWQSSLLNYNKLKLSRYFYNLFNDFEYMLTYELDAYVFKDELIQWCDECYDYIGAVWFENYDYATKDSPIIGVGNSGFSLRNIQTIQKILRKMYYQDTKEFNTSGLQLLKAYAKYIYRRPQVLLGENYSIQKNYNWYEDYFICSIVAQKYPNFKIAPTCQAIKFSYEVNPSLLHQMNNNQLPFGCHAWARYEPEFWNLYINF